MPKYSDFGFDSADERREWRSSDEYDERLDKLRDDRNDHGYEWNLRDMKDAVDATHDIDELGLAQIAMHNFMMITEHMPDMPVEEVYEMIAEHYDDMDYWEEWAEGYEFMEDIWYHD